MSTVEMTDSNINDLVEQHGGELMVIDVWADWCGPCKRFAPVFETVSNAFEDVLFAKVEADKNPGILQYFQIQRIPTILVVRNKELILQHSGIMTQKELAANLVLASV